MIKNGVDNEEDYDDFLNNDVIYDPSIPFLNSSMDRTVLTTSIQ